MNDCKTDVRDVFYTPEALAVRTIELTNLKDNDMVLDAFAGKMVFYNNYPNYTNKDWCEITEEKDFLIMMGKWLIGL